MNVRIKKLGLSLVLAVMLLLPVVQFSNVLAASANQEKAVVFLRDVAGLDMAKYELTFSQDSPNTKYTFESGNNTIDVLCDFRNGVLVACALFPMSGSPLLSQPVTDALTTAKSFVVRYQDFSQASYVQGMRDTLNAVSELEVDPTDLGTMKKASSTSVGNMTLTVWMDEYGYVLFDWMNTVNGIKNPYNRAGFGLRNGVFDQFADDWNVYLVGSADVKISKAQAISLAMERVTGFSYDVGSATIQNLTVAKDFPVSAAVSMQPRDGVLYPHWEIYLPLDRVYLGNVVSVRVMMWADTGEIDSIHASSTLGGPSDEETTTPSPTPSPQATETYEPTASPSPTPQPTASPSPSLQPTQSPSPQPEVNVQGFSAGLAIATGVAVATVIIAGTVLVIKRRMH